MKATIVSLFLFLSMSVSGQNIETTTYVDPVEGYSFDYPSEWDSTAFAPLKKDFNVDFGAIIKPAFNNNRTGGYFSLDKSGSYGETLPVIARETQASLKQVYPNAIVMESKQKISKNGITYHSLVTEIKQSGNVRITNRIQMVKGKHIYAFDFVCPKDGYERLSTYYQMVVNSFKFRNAKEQ